MKTPSMTLGGHCPDSTPVRRRCDACKTAYNRAYYAANEARWAVYHEKQMAERRPERNATTAAWKRANPERHKAYTDAHNARYRAAHPGYQTEWNRLNPEASRQRASRYRAAKYNAFGSHTDAEWQAIVAKQKGVCPDCNEKRTLERDHLVPISKGGSDMAINIVGRCRSCNASKSDSLRYVTQFSIFDSLVALGG